MLSVQQRPLNRMWEAANKISSTLANKPEYPSVYPKLRILLEHRSIENFAHSSRRDVKLLNTAILSKKNKESRHFFWVAASVLFLALTFFLMIASLFIIPFSTALLAAGAVGLILLTTYTAIECTDPPMPQLNPSDVMTKVRHVNQRINELRTLLQESVYIRKGDCYETFSYLSCLLKLAAIQDPTLENKIIDQLDKLKIQEVVLSRSLQS